jgi:hypothetical protein
VLLNEVFECEAKILNSLQEREREREREREQRGKYRF